MSTRATHIPAAAPAGSKLVVTRNAAAGKLTLSIYRGRSIAASLALDTTGWQALHEAAARPHEITDVVCHECEQPLGQVQDCTCVRRKGGAA